MANSGFNNSFDESFKTGMAIGGSAALETMKEKIKKNENQRKSSAIFDLISQKVAEKAISDGKSPEEALTLAEKIQKASKLGFDVSEATAFGKLISPETFDDKPPKKVFQVGQGGKLTNIGEIPGSAEVFKENLTPEEFAARSAAATKAKEEVLLDYPTLDDKAKSAISAYTYMKPSVDRLKELTESGLFRDQGLLKQIAVGKGGQLVVPNGSPLEEAVGLINDMKITGFNIAGTAFTPSEAEVTFGLVSPIGKSDQQYMRDIDSFQRVFETRIQTATEGLRGAKNKASKISSDRNSSSETKKIGNKVYEKRQDGKWYQKKD